MATLVHERNWLLDHAEQDGEGMWCCRSSRYLVEVHLIPRMVQSQDLLGAIVSIMFIEHFSCPVFGHDKDVSLDGHTVHEQDITEVEIAQSVYMLRL